MKYFPNQIVSTTDNQYTGRVQRFIMGFPPRYLVQVRSRRLGAPMIELEFSEDELQPASFDNPPMATLPSVQGSVAAVSPHSRSTPSGGLVNADVLAKTITGIHGVQLWPNDVLKWYRDPIDTSLWIIETTRGNFNLRDSQIDEFRLRGGLAYINQLQL